MRSETLAVFGGSFNPPHVAHTMVCLWVLETQAVDRVCVVPTYQHAFAKDLAPFEDRCAMTRLAVAPLGDRVFVDEIEATLERPSYTLTTLQTIAARGVDVRLVIGADILPERDKWWRWPDIETLAPPIVVGRAGHPIPPELGPRPPLPAVSSTEIRAHLHAGRDPGGLIATTVAAYIAEKELYRQ